MECKPQQMVRRLATPFKPVRLLPILQQVRPVPLPQAQPLPELAWQIPLPVLRLALKERPEEIFVESATSAYFRAPVFSADGREASLQIDSLSDLSKLKGEPITITYRLGGKGHVQTLTLP